MNTLRNLLWMLLAAFMLSTTQGQEVTRFIELYNQGKIKEIQAEAKGYVSPSFLRHEDSVIRPIEKLSKEDTAKLVSSFLENLKTRAKKDGEEIRENDLQEFKTKQEKLNIAWKDIYKIASDADVAISLVRYKLKREIDPQIGILVIFTTRNQLVLATPLDRISREADLKNGVLEGRDVWIAQIGALKAKVEQGGPDQPPTRSDFEPQREIGFNEKNEPIVIGPIGDNYGLLVDSGKVWDDSETEKRELKNEFEGVWNEMRKRFEHLEPKGANQAR